MSRLLAREGYVLAWTADNLHEGLKTITDIRSAVDAGTAAEFSRWHQSDAPISPREERSHRMRYLESSLWAYPHVLAINPPISSFSPGWDTDCVLFILQHIQL